MIMKTLPNIDTLEISFNVLDYEISIEPYLDSLEEKKNERRDSLYKGEDSKSFINIGGIEFEVIHAGKHGYAYILHNDDMELNLAKYRSNVKDFYPVRVRFKAKLLWEQGRLAYQFVANFIRENFNDFDTNKVGRVDLACHVDFIKPDIRDWESFVGRHKSDQAIRFNRQLETLYFGSRKTQKCYCRIYDKTRKCLRERENEWFFDIWDEQGLKPLDVWNIEFELRRGILKELEVETYEDLSSKIQSIWIYLTGKWLTWRVPESSNQRTRMHLRPEWVDIQQAYNEFEFVGFIKRSQQRFVDSRKYVPALSGYITSLAAVLNLDDMDSSIEYMKFAVEDYVRNKKASTFETEVKGKKRILAERDGENVELIARIRANIPKELPPNNEMKLARAERVLGLMEQSKTVTKKVLENQRKLVKRLKESQ